MGERDRETDRKKRVCVAPWWKSNAVINGFIESKKLTLSKKNVAEFTLVKKRKGQRMSSSKSTWRNNER